MTYSQSILVSAFLKTSPSNYTARQNLKFAAVPVFAMQKHSVASGMSAGKPILLGQKSKQSQLKQGFSRVWSVFVFLKPVLQACGGLTMALSAKDLFFGVKNPLWTKFKTVLTDERRKTLEKGGQRIIGFGELLNVPRMIATGFNVNQPGMLLGGLLKIVSSMCMLFAKNEKSRLFAWLIDALTGVIYSVGYDNEIKNQDPTLTDPIRRYDMHAMLNRLKAPFTPGNGLLWHQRLLGAVGNPVREMGKLLWFFLGDNVAIVKDLWRTRLFLKPENRYPVQERANFKQKRKDAAKASWRQRFVNWAKNPSLSKSELAASLGWLGAIPALTAAILKKENLSNHPIIVALRAMTLTAENMPTLSIAMNRQDLPGRMPLVGFPLLLFLTHYGRTINLGLGNLGGGINEFYFSDVALHGVRAHEKKTQKNES